MIVRVNILLFPLLVLAFVFAASIAFEVSWGNNFYVSEMPYIKEVFLVIFLLVGILFSIKTVNRWTGILVFLNKSKYAFEHIEPIGNDGKKRMVMYNSIEGIMYLTFAFGYFYLTEYAFWMGILCSVMVFELILFSILLPKIALLGVRRSSLFVLTRQSKVIPFNNLVRMEKDFNEWFFAYKSGKVLKINLGNVSKDSRQALIKRISDLNPGVFVSDSLED